MKICGSYTKLLSTPIQKDLSNNIKETWKMQFISSIQSNDRPESRYSLLASVACTPSMVLGTCSVINTYMKKLLKQRVFLI